MSVLIPKSAIVIDNIEFQVARADAGDPQMGPALMDPGGHRIGQLVVVVDEAAAKQIREALTEEFGVWDPKTQKRIPHGTRKTHRG